MMEPPGKAFTVPLWRLANRSCSRHGCRRTPKESASASPSLPAPDSEALSHATPTRYRESMDTAPTRVATWKAWRLAGTLLASCVLSGRCVRADDATFYGEMQSVDATMHHGMAIASSGNVDRDFLRMMIPHHQGAIDMAVLLLKYGRDERVRRLAQSIIVEQGQEVAYMRMLLESPPLARPADH